MLQRPARESFGFFHRIRVRWAEVDPQGIVFNPHYLMFADVAWTEYMRAAGCPYPGLLAELGVEMFAVHADLDFFASAVYDDELALGVRTLEVGRTSLRIQVGMFRDATALCSVGLVYVAASLSDKTPMPVPAAFVQMLSTMDKLPARRK